MPKFWYRAINQSGKNVSGVLEAENEQLVSEMLSSRGFIPSKVSKYNGDGSGGYRGRLSLALSGISARDLILFSKQLSTMLKAGVPILRIFQVLENQTENSGLRKIISHIVQDVQEGMSLYEAFRKHPKAFSHLYCSMVLAGETGGTLPAVLDRLIYIIEHEKKVRDDIKAALQYPIIVIVVLFGAFIFLLTFVIPRFVAIFVKAQLDLPWPTKVCIFLNNILTNYWMFILGGLALAFLGLMMYFRTDQGRYLRDSLILRLPVLGSLFVKASMSRFASIFAILQGSGVPIMDTMKILSGTIGNACISKEFDRIQDRLMEGMGIAGPLHTAKWFTPMVVNMVAVGEESGNLDEMLSEVSTHYDVEVEYQTARLTTYINPILTIGLAVIVGFFALAIFLPMWDLTRMVSG